MLTSSKERAECYGHQPHFTCRLLESLHTACMTRPYLYWPRDAIVPSSRCRSVGHHCSVAEGWLYLQYSVNGCLPALFLSSRLCYSEHGRAGLGLASGVANLPLWLCVLTREGISSLCRTLAAGRQRNDTMRWRRTPLHNNTHSDGAQA